MIMSINLLNSFLVFVLIIGKLSLGNTIFKTITSKSIKVSSFHLQSGLQKCPYIGNNFYKNKDTFKIFSPLVLEVDRILWWKPL